MSIEVRSKQATIAALVICAVGAGLRLMWAAHELGAPLIDENEVVEQAVAFMGGDLRQHFEKYGPLTMYVLAAIYHAVAALRGLSALEYASRVFLHGEEHYFIARAFTALTISALGLAAFFQFRRRSGLVPALAVCTLLCLPCVDALVSGARIDMTQAAFQGFALLALGEVAQGGGRRIWLAAGAFAGLAVASKPLPGLLLLPCFPITSWFAVEHDASGAPRRLGSRLLAAVSAPGLWLAGAVCIGAAVLGDPAMLRPREFMESQRAAVALHSGRLAPGPSILASFQLLGLPLCIALAASLIVTIQRGSAAARLAGVFFAIYVGAFWGRSRHYFLVAAAVAACLLIGHAFTAAREFAANAGERGRAVFRAAWVPLLVVLIAPSLMNLAERAETPSLAREARDWVEANIAPGTGVYYVGWRAAGPPLVAQNASVQAKFGDHFSYGRDQYPFLKLAYERGYADYEASGAPRYVIASHHDKPFSRKSKRTPRSITDGLLKTARARKLRYVIVAGYDEPDLSRLGYTWFKDAILEKEFGKIAIFRVPDSALAGATAPLP